MMTNYLQHPYIFSSVALEISRPLPLFSNLLQFKTSFFCNSVFGLVVFSDFSSLEQDEETEKYICADTLFKRLDESDNLSSLLPMKDLIEVCTFNFSTF